METTMPCDKGLENSVLGTLILYPETYKDIRDFIIEDDVFYQKKAKLLKKRKSWEDFLICMLLIALLRQD